MDELSENDIGKLLRLKRHEQPPPAYFENFIHEFHRRQRDNAAPNKPANKSTAQQQEEAIEQTEAAAAAIGKHGRVGGVVLVGNKLHFFRKYFLRHASHA